MARKKKVVIVDEELTPTVLYTKKEKKGSVIWLIFIFAIFIVVVIKLPEITEYVENYFNPGSTTPVNPNNPNNNDNNNDDDVNNEEVEEYQLSADLQITEDNFYLSNFVVNNNQISFTVTNTGEEILDFSTLDYFLNLYNANKMLLQRIMINDEIVPIGGSSNLVYDLSDSNISTITFMEINEEDYPAHVVDADDAGNATLICTKGYETVSYSLTNNLVYAILDVFSVSATDPNYSTLYSNYQALSMTYNTIGGIDSTVSVIDNVLIFRTNINLRTVSNNSFNSIIYYPLNTDAKVMNFELEANGYTCN